MALIIEDGTGKPDASSYVTAQQARAYALSRGTELSDDDTQVEQLLVRAMDYLEAQRTKYQGVKTYPGLQALQWPRSGVILDCSYQLPDNIIPVELKNAQMQLALESFNGLVLLPSSDGRVVKREKVDVIETEYMTGQDLGSGAVMGPSFPAVDALLDPLFSACGGGGFFLKTVRV